MPQHMLESSPSISTTRTLLPSKSSGNPRDLTYKHLEGSWGQPAKTTTLYLLHLWTARRTPARGHGHGLSDEVIA